MRNYKFFQFLLAIILLTHTACKKKFLDVPIITSNAQVIKQEYIKDLAASEQYVAGIYIDLTRYFFNGYYFVYPDLIADNVKLATGSTTLINHYSWAQLASEDAFLEPSSSRINMNGFWASGYRTIRSCNFILENIDRFREENPAKADKLKGQCLALRAMAHFYLVNAFAQPYTYTGDGNHTGIPYVFGSDWTLSMSRDNVATVYDDIIKDFEQAIPLLPVASLNTEKMYMNQVAAKALLARTYLFKGDNQNAKDMSRQAIAAVPFMTTGYPEKLYTPDDKESLFWLPPSATTYTSTFPGVYYFTLQYLGSKDIVDILRETPADKRIAWVTASGSDWRISKFPRSIIPGVSASNGYYMTLIRSSEMYLTAAETYAKLGNVDSARYFLDAIRQRANATAASTSATGTALLDSIYKERRKELCFENLRMYDLLRTGKGVKRSDPYTPEAANLPFPSDKAIAPIHKLDVSYYGLSQNPGF